MMRLKYKNKVKQQKKNAGVVCSKEPSMKNDKTDAPEVLFN